MPILIETEIKYFGPFIYQTPVVNFAIRLHVSVQQVWENCTETLNS